MREKERKENGTYSFKIISQTENSIAIFFIIIDFFLTPFHNQRLHFTAHNQTLPQQSHTFTIYIHLLLYILVSYTYVCIGLEVIFAREYARRIINVLEVLFCPTLPQKCAGCIIFIVHCQNIRSQCQLFNSQRELFNNGKYNAP